MENQSVYDQLIQLCRVPSVSETPGEIRMAEAVARLLEQQPYFQAHPHQVGLEPVLQDPYKRPFVYGYVEGRIKSPKTVILLSHLDVVDVTDYGMMAELAFDPEAYTRYLKDHPELRMPEEARADLESGDYLFGRGTMDMKFGIAAHLNMLERAAAQADFEGNLLLLSVPDEEANSAGMRGAVDFLLALRQEKQWEYTGCLVSEPHFPQYEGDTGLYLYTGTIGKLLPVFYCVGKESHVGEPFAGLNPNLLTGKLVEKIEANPQLADQAGGMFTPAPLCLKQSDTKTGYSVQTPGAAYAYFNYMTLSKSPQQVLEALLDIGREAFQEVLQSREDKAKAFETLTGHPVQLPAMAPRVLTYGELYRQCEAVHGESFRDHISRFMAAAEREADPRSADLRHRSLELVQEVHRFFPDREPVMIVFYAPPFYPHSELPRENSLVMEVSRYLIQLARQQHQINLQHLPFFTGLSDMSYLGLSSKLDVHTLGDHFPLWEGGYRLPLKTLAALNIPFLNLGPLGKDAHQWTERLCLSYSFQRALPLLWAAICRFLGYEAIPMGSFRQQP